MSEALLRLLSLKSVLRKGWTRHLPVEQVESVADHSYGVALLAWLLSPPNIDRGRVIELALLHDLAEAITGDLTPADGVPTEIKREGEKRALSALLEDFPSHDSALSLLQEYQEGATPEARFVKALDKLDMSLQSVLYQREHGGDLSEFRESARARLEEAGMLGMVPDVYAG